MRGLYLLSLLTLPPPRRAQFTSETGGSNPKNYQIWYHRRSLLSLLTITSTTFATELQYVTEVLLDDSKNYHAWSHRQFLVEKVSSSNMHVYGHTLCVDGLMV